MDPEKLIGAEAYIHFNAFQKVAVFHGVCAGYEAVEFFVILVPSDGIQSVVPQLVLTLQ